MLKLLKEGDEMKEKILKNKMVIGIGIIIILNVLWLSHTQDITQKGTLIQDEGNQLEMECGNASQSIPEAQENLITEPKIDVTQDKLFDQEASTKQEVTTSLEQKSMDEAKMEEARPVVTQVPIYICGEVLQPGVYEVASTAIINDVVKKAGGLTREADLTAINLASPVQPNEKIIIPKEGQEIDKLEDSYENRERNETLPSAQPAMESPIDVSNERLSGLVNINTATKEQLMTLNGIGAVKAEAIIAYRQEKGRFDSIDEIMQISGIGDKTFEKIKQFITT